MLDSIREYRSHINSIPAEYLAAIAATLLHDQAL
jgi:hypothetical protein